MKRVSRRTLLLASSTSLLAGCTPVREATSSRSTHRAESAQPRASETPAHPSTTFSSKGEWIRSWVSAQQLVEPENQPPARLSQSALRQRLLLTLGGVRLRLRISNEYGKTPLEIRHAHIALPSPPTYASGAHINESSRRLVTFFKKQNVVVPPGATVASDPVEMAVASETELAVTLFLGEVPTELTGHPGSRTTSYLTSNTSVDTSQFDGALTTEHWYFLSDVEVEAPPESRAVVILGDSITDGRGSTTNLNDRWPNILARRLLAEPSTQHLAVLNQGMGGNRVLQNGLGPPLLQRFRRDAIEIEKARFLILFAGINDLGALHGPTGGSNVEKPPPSAARLIDAFDKMARAAHEKNQSVYGITLLPYEGSFYFTSEGEGERQKFNKWIRTTKSLDACIDFDALTRDERNPTRLHSTVDGGDHLHPSAQGYGLMGRAIALKLFEGSFQD